jgi:hypothetical protein
MSQPEMCARVLCRRQRQAITVLLPLALRTAQGRAWLLAHGERALTPNQRILASTAILERQEKAGAGARAKWARMTPEQRSKDAEKRATKGWKTRRAKLEKPIP